MVRAVAAVDLGAKSGRVMLGYVGHNELRLQPVARFPNGPVDVAGSLHWNVSGLFDHVVTGLASAAKQEPDLASVAVDSWAVDYGLMRGSELTAEPFHYRDPRTVPAIDAVHSRVPAADLYAATGLQRLPFNTVYQLAEDQLAGRLEGIDRFLLIPDLITYWLTGRQFSERTNASTTALFNVHTGEWDDALIERVGLPRSIFPELVSAGSAVGGLLPSISDRIGLPSLQVSTVGSHDTASAIVAVPATDPDFAYISSGTWALVGVELEAPVLTEASRVANFTNEGGVDGRVRYLRNVMGLWILSESVREWDAELLPLLAAAAASPVPTDLFDVDDPRFAAPGDMPSRIADWYTERGLAAPTTQAAIVRAILESLAEAYAATVRQAVELSGKTVNVIHLLGGGSQNELLCQLTADRSGLPVLAGPAEATAIGNVLVQARAQGLVSGSLESLRAIVAQAFNPKRYDPRS
jgi:rhamnulokinase